MILFLYGVPYLIGIIFESSQVIVIGQQLCEIS